MAVPCSERRIAPRWSWRCVWAGLALSAALTGGACWAVMQAKAQGEEDKVRAVARDYYAATASGDTPRCLATVRLPMTVISNGLTTFRSEAQLRALLARVAARSGSKPLTAEERTRVSDRVRGMFEEADVTFIGADTAAVAFLLRAGTTQDEGDLVAMLILRRLARDWRVIAEIHDSVPVPRSYLPPEAPAPANDTMPPSTETPPPPADTSTPPETK
jgi:hypothetical protein